MEKIKLCCAKCGFTIEEYAADEVANVPRKAKRYKYLLQKSSICPACLASGRLKEVRATEEAGGAPSQAAATVTPKSSVTAAAAETHEEHPDSPTPMMDALSQGPWPSHAAELKKTKYPVQMYETGAAKADHAMGLRRLRLAAGRRRGRVGARLGASGTDQGLELPPHHGSLRQFLQNGLDAQTLRHLGQIWIWFAALAQHRRRPGDARNFHRESQTGGGRNHGGGIRRRLDRRRLPHQRRMHRPGQMRPGALRHAWVPRGLVQAIFG